MHHHLQINRHAIIYLNDMHSSIVAVHPFITNSLLLLYKKVAKEQLITATIATMICDYS
ncbi:hypothetical protein XD13_04945 [Staphylococcus aureus]|uniref:Uncharacterized protein n=1 Tax=Staphylococcus aureus TaxID=1280 RepID=A0AAP7YSD6_STAAU|nr:hypothetical protein KQ76_02225 [Staphylococcus aureus]EFU24237.1 hypothetical protein CGSSa00_12447 [Staphylococcus aureus subsp. aureus CGS00]OFL38182.1 hypothetical protein HMPREF2770_13240 [Staphylococcus sp. HMSC075C08]OHO98504.1 hypothetical protein HMPREF2671_07120 [Staphylococcus sp. HMSC058E01]OHP84276.1 hypothetical protein HMPREF2658_00515 [Staphylococcus sp. HMSC062H10]OHQ04537.1 hypothetical protein HMPREF2733_04820 [Staphylococcus sp. HMSC063H12]OHS61947.1 hypothetical protei